MASKKRKRPRKPRPPEGAGEGVVSSTETEEAAAPPPPKPVKRSQRHSAKEEPPPAPWGKFPLVELAVLAGIILIVAGLIVGGEAGLAVLGAGLLLASIAGLEVSVREHLAGYRSHTLILAGLPTVAVIGLLFLLGDEFAPAVRILIAGAVFGLSAFVLTRIFAARSGGRAFRIAKPRRGV